MCAKHGCHKWYTTNKDVPVGETNHNRKREGENESESRYTN